MKRLARLLLAGCAFCMVLTSAACGNVSDSFATRDFATPDEVISPTAVYERSQLVVPDANSSDDTENSDTLEETVESTVAAAENEAADEVSDSSSAQRKSVGSFDVNPNASDKEHVGVSSVENRKEHLKEVSPSQTDIRIVNMEDNIVAVSYILTDDSQNKDSAYWEKYIEDHWQEYQALAEDMKATAKADAFAVYINVYNSTHYLIVGRTLIC